MKTRIAYIGYGPRGKSLIGNLLDMDDVEITVVCELRSDRLEELQKIVEEKYGHPVYATDNHKYAVSRDDVDVVIAPTSFNSHLPIAIEAMKNGKYCGFEVGPVGNINDCYELVKVREETGVPCMVMENCCYGRYELTALNAIKKGLFGEIVHCRGGYQHDLRCFATLNQECERSYHYINRNGDIYPTHGLGPVMKYLDINRGNRMVSLSSMASQSRGFYLKGMETDGEKSICKNGVKLGDVVTTMIKCARGETILITHDTSLPRPYSRCNLVQGTKGLWMEDKDSIYIEGRSELDKWEPMDNYMEEFEHPLWKEFNRDGVKGGHGGMDWLLLRSLIESFQNKTDTPIDIYDSACMIVMSCLSEMSIERGGAPVDFPDFTSGKWIKREPAPKSKYSLDAVHDDLFNV